MSEEKQNSDNPHTGSLTVAAFTDEERRLLQERAARLAHEDARQPAVVEDQVVYVCFRLGDVERYGIPSRHTDEIMTVSEITPVPCTPAHIAGVANRRGELLPVLDVRVFFRTSGSERSDEARIVIVSGHGMTVGILADEVFGNDAYRPSELSKPLPSDGVTRMDCIKGIHRGEVTILDVDALLQDKAILVDESVN